MAFFGLGTCKGSFVGHCHFAGLSNILLSNSSFQRDLRVWKSDNDQPVQVSNNNDLVYRSAELQTPFPTRALVDRCYNGTLDGRRGGMVEDYHRSCREEADAEQDSPAQLPFVSPLLHLSRSSQEMVKWNVSVDKLSRIKYQAPLAAPRVARQCHC